MLPERHEFQLEPDVRQAGLEVLGRAERHRCVGHEDDRPAAAQVPGRERLGPVEVASERVDVPLPEAGDRRRQVLVGLQPSMRWARTRSLLTAKFTAWRSCGLSRKSGLELLRTYICMVSPGSSQNRS